MTVYRAFINKRTHVKLLLGLTFAIAAQGGLIGTAVTGDLQFATDSTNYFDAANGFVPGTCLNSAGATVVVDGQTATFCFDDTNASLVGQFTDHDLMIAEAFGDLGAADWTMTFTFEPGLIRDIVPTSDTFGSGGLTSSFAGDTLTLGWTGSLQDGANFAATFGLTSSDSPEPSTGFILLGSFGLLAIRRTAISTYLINRCR